jgi:ribosomal protein L18E
LPEADTAAMALVTVQATMELVPATVLGTDLVTARVTMEQGPITVQAKDDMARARIKTGAGTPMALVMVQATMELVPATVLGTDLVTARVTMEQETSRSLFVTVYHN